MMPSLDTFPVPLIHINETNSTNNYLQSLCSEQKVEELTVVVADFQTSGRGQRGNSWESDPGKNLLFSTVIFPEFLEARRQFLISQIISLAIKEELDTYTTDISIKWPNDIYWKEKKICGMLIENDLMGRNISQSIIGIGININQEIFHSSAPNPVSLLQITECPPRQKRPLLSTTTCCLQWMLCVPLRTMPRPSAVRIIGLCPATARCSTTSDLSSA